MSASLEPEVLVIEHNRERIRRLPPEVEELTKQDSLLGDPPLAHSHLFVEFTVIAVNFTSPLVFLGVLLGVHALVGWEMRVFFGAGDWLAIFLVSLAGDHPRWQTPAQNLPCILLEQLRFLFRWVLVVLVLVGLAVELVVLKAILCNQ